MSEIKAGDVVQLKSGGPKMTVSKVYQNTHGVPAARCEWFEGTKPTWGSFPIQSLNKSE
jgi:uncharacterized protein YodC (DUF2158 family)